MWVYFSQQCMPQVLAGRPLPSEILADRIFLCVWCLVLLWYSKGLGYGRWIQRWEIHNSRYKIHMHHAVMQGFRGVGSLV